MRLPSVWVEIVETRLMLSVTGGMDAAVTQSNAVVQQYSAVAEQQYLAPVQSELETALNSFIAETAASTSIVGVDQTSADTSLGVLAGAFGTTSAIVTTESQQVLGDAQSSTTQTSSTVDLAVGSGSSASTSTSTSLFDQGTDLQSVADSLGTSAFGTFGASSGTTAGTGSQTVGTTPSSGAGDSTSTSSGDSTSTSGSDSDTSGDSDSSSSNDDSSDSSSGGGWQPFVLPDGIVFEDVHLPAEEFAENLSLLQPTGTDSFSNTTIAEDSLEGTTTSLSVTLSQSYLGAERWIVTQSWTKEYTIHESSGEGSGSWSVSTRHGATTLTITVSLGYGVPDRPDIGKKTQPATSNEDGGSTGSSSIWSASGTSETDGSLSPASPTIVPVGVVTTISFSTSDSLTTSVGGSHDGSDEATGKVDSGSFSGSSSASASKTLVLTSFDVLRPDGTLGHTIQLSAADERSAGMSFKGGNTLFEAEGDVKDGDGNTTNNGTNPWGSPFNSPGSKPPTDGDDFFDDTEPPPPMGGNGSRVDASAGIAVSSSFSTGSYFLAEATTAVGAELEEADISGSAGMHTDYDGTIAVNDSLSLDVQSSDATSGSYDYLSLGWKQAANAKRGLHFSYDLSLSDADLPDESESDSSNPILPTSTTNGSTSSLTSSGTATSGTTSDSSTSGTSGSSGTSGATSGGANNGNGSSTGSQPAIELESHSSNGGNSKVWVQARSNTTSETPSPIPGAPPSKTTEKSVTSVRIGGSSDISASTTLVNWMPAVTATAKGEMNITLLNSSIRLVEHSFDTAPPPGSTLAISEKRDVFKNLNSASAMVAFDVAATLSLNAQPALTGTVTFDVIVKEQLYVKQVAHEKIVSLSNPAMFYETWFLYQVVQEYITSLHGGVGGASNSLTATKTGLAYTYLETAAAGTPPAPPAPATSTLTTALDYLQTGLDVAGLVPVLGEAADATNAGIHVCRGNYGEAATSMAAMIPVGGQAVTVGKFANKAVKAVANNADKLDELADGTKAVVQQVIKRNPQQDGAAIRKINNAIRDHLKPHDIPGALKDCLGTPVVKSTGNAYDHFHELTTTLNGLRNNAAKLNGATDAAAIAARQSALDQIRQIESALQGLGI